MRNGTTELIGLVGGTGPLGRGLALRLGYAGFDVLLGSRDRSRAVLATAGIADRIPKGTGTVRGARNDEVVERCPVVVLAIPYEAVAGQLDELRDLVQGQVVISAAVPMAFRGGLPFADPPPAGSAAQAVAALCPEALVVGAFHTVAAGPLLELEAHLDQDVLVSGDDQRAKRQVMSIVQRIEGLRPIDAGGLATAVFCESLTPLLLRLNRIHRAHTGIRITGLA